MVLRVCVKRRTRGQPTQVEAVLIRRREEHEVAEQRLADLASHGLDPRLSVALHADTQHLPAWNQELAQAVSGCAVGLLQRDLGRALGIRLEA